MALAGATLAVDRRPTDHPLLHHLSTKPSLSLLKPLHARMLRLDLLSSPFPFSRLLTALASSPSTLPHALSLFHHHPSPSLYSHNLLVRALASSHSSLSLSVFLSLLRNPNLAPDRFSFPPAVKAAAAIAPSLALALHGFVAKTVFGSDLYVLNSMVGFYVSVGDCGGAVKMFERMPVRDVVSWNTVVNGLARAGRCEEAVRFFERMVREGEIRPNGVTLVGVLSACGRMGELGIGLGRWVEGYVDRGGVRKDLILRNALSDMYVKCGSFVDAERVFEGMPERDSFSWTTMVVGYAKEGRFRDARQAFDSIGDKGVESWNALVSGYERGGRPREALYFFRELLVAKVRPDEITLVSALSACAEIGALEMGCWIHEYARRNGVKLNNHLKTSLIDMYSKCGDLEKAIEVFETAKVDGDVFVWSAMIAAMAMHGHGRAALDLFEKMQEANVMPNGVTFTNVLSACSHAGLVDEAWDCLNKMLPVFRVEPKVEHYASMVDILGRAGCLQEATKLIGKMPMSPSASVWGAMLGSCLIHRNVELGEYAFSQLVKLQPTNDGAYILLSNLYAKTERWDDVGRLRKMMKDARMKKEPGCSSIEVEGVVHEFLVGDTTHSLSEEIYNKLEEMAMRLKVEKKYIPKTSQVLQQVEDEKVKEQALNLHSEKLAIAFGLISTEPQVPIRIMKNLRVCEDCHEVARLISSLYDREILLRDRYRFHCFKGGVCSCMGYW